MRLIDADKLEAHEQILPLGNGMYESVFIVYKDDIDDMPTVDAVPVVHGRWIRDEFGTKCGVCGLYAYRDKFGQPWESPYCPNCGSRNRSEE